MQFPQNAFPILLAIFRSIILAKNATTAAENRESLKHVPDDEISFRQLQKARRPDQQGRLLISSRSRSTITSPESKPMKNGKELSLVVDSSGGQIQERH